MVSGDPGLARQVAHGWTSMGLVLLSGGVLGRGFCLRRLITVREARMVRASDRILWAGAAVVGSGLLWQAALAGFHGQPRIWLRAALLGALLGLDAWPARRFRSWARHLDLDQVPYHTDRDQDRMRLLWKLQLVALFLMPLLEPLAQGCGSPR